MIPELPELLSRPVRECIPPRDVSDRLVQQYLRTFEPVFRVLHVPTFLRDYGLYWTSPQAAGEYWELQLLLVLAIGTCFYQDASSPDGDGDGNGEGTNPTLHQQSIQWVHTAHIRLSAPFRKKHLDFAGVQAQCLLVLALLTNTNAIRGDLFSITTASLAQSAMAIGLHFRPSQMAISPFEAENRKRLWAAVLELVVQAALHSGMQPTIPIELLDSHEMPSNLDDSQISESTKVMPCSQPTNRLTQSSIQCALMKSLPVRFRIAQALGRSRTDLPYDVTQRMGAELTGHLRETSDLIDSFAPTPSSVFPIRLQDLLARRFLFVLHAQFAHKASSDANHYFSRTVCLECSRLVLSHSRNAGSGADGTGGDHDNDSGGGSDDYHRLRLRGDGLFRSVFLGAAVNVCAEVLLQMHEDSAPAVASLPRHELLQPVEDAAALTRRRIAQGDNSIKAIKALVFFACVLAKTGAGASRPRGGQRRRPSLQAGPSGADTGGRGASRQTYQAVEDAAGRALEVCCGMLEARLAAHLTARARAAAARTKSSEADGGQHSSTGSDRFEIPQTPQRNGEGKIQSKNMGVAQKHLEEPLVRNSDSSWDDSSEAWLSQLTARNEW